MRRRSIWWASGFGASLTLTSVSLPALADQIAADALIDEAVVVTVRKRPESQQDVPGAVTALIPGYSSDGVKLDSLRDITDQIIGINANPDPFAPGVYRNGAFMGSSLDARHFARMDIFDSERVEALRGPQGALYGSTATHGAMNIVTNRPGDELDLQLGLAGSSADQTTADIILNAPISDKWSTRFSYVMDDVTNQAEDEAQYRHARAAIRFEPNANININYSFDTQDDAVTGALDTVAPSNADLNYRHQIDNHNVEVVWDLGHGTITASSNYRDSATLLETDIGSASATAPLPTFKTRQSADDDIFFQELRYAANGTDQFTWIVGADYLTRDNEARAETPFLSITTGPTGELHSVDVSLDAWAVFGSVQYRFSNMPVTVSWEARYAVDAVDGNVLSLAPQLGLPPTSDLSRDERFTNLPWTVTASYGFSADALAYVKVASSYRHGGLNLKTPRSEPDGSPVQLNYGEEDSLTYEAGLKSKVSRGVTFNLAAFYTFYQDFHDPAGDYCAGECAPFDSRLPGTDANNNAGIDLSQALFSDNIGEVEVWGLEAEVSVHRQIAATGGTMQFNAGWTRQLGRVDDLDAASGALGVSNGRLNSTQPKQVKTTMVYRQPLSSFGNFGFLENLTLQATANWSLERGGFRSLTLFDAAELDRVSRVNASIGVETEKWSLIARGENITDAELPLSTATLYRRVDPDTFELEFTWRLR